MGNTICRVILSKDASSDVALRFGSVLRAEVQCPTMLYLRDLRGKRIRDPRLVAARDAEFRLMDLEPTTRPDVLVRTADATIGEGRFVVRVADDEVADRTLPDVDALERFYPGVELRWALEPDERPIPWNNDSFFLVPGNPSHWGLKVPLMAALLEAATPGSERPCPMCRTRYTSQGDRGQCPSCGFVAQPFRTLEEAIRRTRVPLDAFAWGRCPRCRRAREFTYRVEQCFRCGQLLEACSDRHKLVLIDDNDEISSLLASLNLK